MPSESIGGPSGCQSAQIQKTSRIRTLARSARLTCTAPVATSATGRTASPAGLAASHLAHLPNLRDLLRDQPPASMSFCSSSIVRSGPRSRITLTTHSRHRSVGVMIRSEDTRSERPSPAISRTTSSAMKRDPTASSRSRHWGCVQPSRRVIFRLPSAGRGPGGIAEAAPLATSPRTRSHGALPHQRTSRLLAHPIPTINAAMLVPTWTARD